MTAEHESDIFDGEDREDCMTCLGDGWLFGYDMDEPLDYEDDELVRCPNCRGSGSAKDQQFW